MFKIVRFVLCATFIHKITSAHNAECWRDTPCSGLPTTAFPGAWDKFNYSPASRIVSPTKILSKSGTYMATFPANVELQGNGSQFIYDFEKEISGIVTIAYSSNGSARLGLAFSEAKNWTGEWSDDTNGSFNPDGALYANVTATKSEKYEMPLEKLRGGFRYLTLFEESKSDVQIHILNVTVEISFQPDWPNLRAYKGYFSCSDDLLTKIWYSGAYTLQTNAIPPSTGREFPILRSSWLNDGDLSLGVQGSTVYVDGSKRDRTIWPGDLGVAVPSILVSTGDWDGVRTTLNVLYAGQANSGELPFAGPRINIYGSDTYHMATLLGTYDYFLWTNDIRWIVSIYENKFKKAVTFISDKIDYTGMLNVTGTEDWGRLKQGGHNTEANILLYNVLMKGAQIANWMDDSEQGDIWIQLANTLRVSVNTNNMNYTYGAYQDDDVESSLYPQDANSLALLYEFSNPEDTPHISNALTHNWISIGSLAPELPNNLVGFGQSLEVKGHLVAHQASRALELVRRAWGWYLSNPYGTGSTCIEGYRADGSFGYRAERGYGNDYSYTSHAHGWSTGPTDALTSYIVGLTVTAPGGMQWALAPQFADLSHAEAGFTTPTGKFSAKWNLNDDGYSLSWDVPTETSGIITINMGPAGISELVLDGDEQIVDRQELDPTTGSIIFPGEGGKHFMQVIY